MLVYTLALWGIFVISCTENEQAIRDKKVYDGPVRQAKNVEMYYSEVATRKSFLKTPRMLEFKDGNREFPDGLYLEFFNEQGEKSSVLRADYAEYMRVEKLWKATGDVEVKSLLKEQQLNTEELYWKPEEERIYTDKFVTIRQQDEVLYGTGLESDQDFTDFTITNLSGDIKLK